MEQWVGKSNFFLLSDLDSCCFETPDYMNSTGKISYVENNFVS